MAATDEVDARLQELQERVGDLVAQLEGMASVKKSLSDTADGLAGARESVSRLADDLRPVVASLQTVARSFQGAVDAFERIEPAKVVQELELLGARVGELEGRIDATRDAQAETLPKVVEEVGIVGTRVGELVDATRTAQAKNATKRKGVRPWHRRSDRHRWRDAVAAVDLSG